ncbi:UNVERIFIED_CONTAM: hypothetical protein NCL1_51286 [Trichonephila clavipes]
MSKSSNIKLIEGIEAPSREVEEHVEEVTKRNIEIARRKKEQIELAELQCKQWLHHKTVEIVWHMQHQTRKIILRQQMFYEKQRKARITEMEQGHAETVGLQHEQAESAIRLQHEQEGSLPWLIQELEKSIKQIQKDQIISSKRLLEEEKGRIQKLQDALKEIKQNRQENAKVSLGLLRRNETVRKELEKEIARSQRKHAEITQLFEKEQKVFSLRLQRGQAASSCKHRKAALTALSRFKRGRAQGKAGPAIYLQQEQEEPEISLKQEQAKPEISLRQEQAKPELSLKQEEDGSTQRLQQQQVERALHPQQKIELKVRLLQPGNLKNTQQIQQEDYSLELLPRNKINE